MDLGWVKLRQHDAVEVRVVGLWKRGAKEPCWLATNLDVPLGRLAIYYDRRMAIEEQFRDTKGARFGFALVWTQITSPPALARFLLLIGLTILIQTALGQAIVDERPDVRLPCPRKGPRLSVLNVALLMGSSFVFSQPVSLSFIVQHLPPPILGDFPWLRKYKKAS